jgi:integrase
VEAKDLLVELKKRSIDVHDMALFSLHTGARAGEVFNLRWADVDISQGLLIFKDTKSGKNRPAFLTEDVKVMLTSRQCENTDGDALVFPGKGGVKITQISDSFNRAVTAIKLNEGCTDRLMKVTFHTLRHTFASWLAMDGVNPFHLKELMGHSDLKLTERYSHLSNDALREAAMRVQNE